MTLLLSCLRAPRDRSGHFDAVDEVIGRTCFGECCALFVGDGAFIPRRGVAGGEHGIDGAGPMSGAYSKRGSHCTHSCETDSDCTRVDDAAALNYPYLRHRATRFDNVASFLFTADRSNFAGSNARGSHCFTSSCSSSFGFASTSSMCA